MSVCYRLLSWVRVGVGVMLALATLGVRGAPEAPTFLQVFEAHGAVMLLIAPESGQIVDANPAAVAFYGYPRDTLRAMRIDQINTFTPEQIAEERRLAANRGRNYFIFRHRTADGSLKTVEVHSQPFRFGDRQLLLSIINDVTPGRLSNQGLWHYQNLLEAQVADQVQAAHAARRREEWLLLGGLLLQAGVIVLLVFNIRRRKRLERAHDALTRAVSEERQRLVDILWGTGAGTWEWILDTGNMRVNSQWASLVGRAPETVAGMTEP